MSLSKLILSTAMIAGLCACTAAEQSVSQADASVVKTGEQIAQTVAKKKTHPHHRATVKPGASVTLNSVLPKSMASGSYQTVQLQLSDGYTDGALSVTIEPSAGLSLYGGNSSKTFDMSGPGPHIWDVDVKADTDGVYFLNVFSEAQGQPRSFSVRMNMGVVTQKMLDEATPAEGELVDGGKLRVLEADETIR